MNRYSGGVLSLLASIALVLSGGVVWAQSANGFLDTIKGVISDPAFGSMIMSKFGSPSTILGRPNATQPAYGAPSNYGSQPNEGDTYGNAGASQNTYAPPQSPMGQFDTYPGGLAQMQMSGAPFMPSNSAPQSFAPANSQMTITNRIAPAELKQLSRYDLSVLIDKSGSMSTRDCPGMMMGGAVTRWEWCREQSSILAQQTNGALPAGITIVPFASSWRRFANVNPNGINSIFNTAAPEGSTNLAGALQSELDRYFQERDSGMRQRPQMIAVITDGVPDSKGAVRRVIKEATLRMTRPDEIKIVFFMIGEDQSGADFVDDLPARLIDEGAAFNIVLKHPFGEVNQLGLARSLASSAIQ